MISFIGLLFLSVGWLLLVFLKLIGVLPTVHWMIVLLPLIFLFAVGITVVAGWFVFFLILGNVQQIAI